MNVKKVGEFIKQKRKEKKLTQKELAEKLSITDRAISKWERGICCPDISILKELSSILEVSVNELLAGEEIAKLEKEKTDAVLISSVNKYTSIEKRKRLGLWLLTISVVIINIIFIFIMFLMYNQINGTGGMAINSIQNKYFTDEILTLMEEKNYEQLALKTGNLLYFNNCPLGENGYDYVCLLKELNDSGVEFVSHKNLGNYFDYLNDISQYEVTIKYKDKEEKMEIALLSNNGHLREIYFYKYIVSENLTCTNIYDKQSWCFNELSGKSNFLFEIELDEEQFFPKEINEKIIKLFSFGNYTCD